MVVSRILNYLSIRSVAFSILAISAVTSARVIGAFGLRTSGPFPWIMPAAINCATSPLAHADTSAASLKPASTEAACAQLE